MRKVYCYAEKEEKPEEIDHSGDIVQDLSSLNISDIKNKRFFFIGGEIIENPYYEPSEYMKRVYAAIDAQYERFYRSDNDKKDSDEKDDVKDAEEETNEQSSDDEMPDWIAEMPYGELIKRFPGGISEALEYAKKEKGLSVPEVHYDSPEPEKLGVKAFTKNAEVYLAPGEREETLKHELGHVVQQKKEKIPATTKIGEQQVNLDPKFEQEADEIAEHIEDHIPEIISNESTNTETKDVIQFGLPSDEELQDKIKEQAIKMGMSSDLIMDSAIEKTKEYYNSKIDWLTSWLYTSWFKDYLDVCINWALQSIKTKIENASSAKLFASNFLARGEDRNNFSLKDALDQNVLDKAQYERSIKCISQLEECCDSKGIIAVLEGANINVVARKVMLSNLDSKFNHPEVFVRRLELMTEYIETVYKKFDKKYLIQSTGSDPHKKGEHTLILINKETKEKFVYKPHDMTADSALVGKTESAPALFGIFAEINQKIKEANTDLDEFLSREQKEEFLRGDALATMKIDSKAHLEEFIRPKKEMTSKEAKLYFFRAGILEAIARSMGVTDLHHDNIMPTANGPLIIDAEVNFTHYGKATGLTAPYGALVSDTDSDDNNVNSTFTITNVGPSGATFKEGDVEFRNMYKKGYMFMLKQINDNMDTYAEIFQNKIRDVKRIRILPVKTAQFSDSLQQAVQEPAKSGKFADELVSLIEKGLEQNFLDSRKIKVTIFKSDTKNSGSPTRLKAAIAKTFTDGTIPALYIDMKGNIWLDDSKIGAILLKSSSTNGKRKKDSQVKKSEMVNIMTECFKNTAKKINLIQTIDRSPQVPDEIKNRLKTYIEEEDEAKIINIIEQIIANINNGETLSTENKEKLKKTVNEYIQGKTSSAKCTVQSIIKSLLDLV